MSKAHVIVYSRPGCHLCDAAKEVLASAGCETEFVLEEINIESSHELLVKYRYDIPVVLVNGIEAFRHRVDANKFCELLRTRPSPPE